MGTPCWAHSWAKAAMAVHRHSQSPPESQAHASNIHLQNKYQTYITGKKEMWKLTIQPKRELNRGPLDLKSSAKEISQ